MILKDKNEDHISALVKLRIESLYDRREAICLKFVKKGLRLDHKYLESFDKANPLLK